MFALKKYNLLQTAKQHKFLTSLGIFYIASVIIGAYRFYTPLPQGDMWDGYINFYIQLLNGDYSAWLAQHNEHRPILSRILFFIDLEYFDGLSATLIPLNVIFLIFTWIILIYYAARLLAVSSTKNNFFYFFILLTVFSFSWKQEENITWAFQSQFWLAYLLPLLSFTLMSRSLTADKYANLYFTLSLLTGILSAGTMANGIITLPILATISIIKRQHIIKTSLLLLCSIVLLFLYINNYQTPEQHHSIIRNITESPIDITIFFIEYLGAPLKSLVLSFILGIAHLYLIIQVFRQKEILLKNNYYLAACAFIVYYLSSAVITAAGRADLGISAALVSRYTTPSIISLFLCLTLYLSIFPQHFRYFSKRNITIIAILMLGTQTRTFIKNTSKIHDNDDVQTLQLELGVHRIKEFQAIADDASKMDISVFGTQPFIDKRTVLYTKINQDSCRKISNDTTINIDKSAVSVDNIMRIPITNNLLSRTVLYLTNHNNAIVSMALVSRLNNKTANLIVTEEMMKQTNEEYNLYHCNSE